MFSRFFVALLLVTCSLGEQQMHFQFDFNPNLPRLGNLGTPSPLPAGNAGQSPEFHSQSIHYIELAESIYTAYGEGEILYEGERTTLGGSNAIYHDEGKFAAANEIFFSVPLANITPGNYTWVRTSVAYQEYTILWNLKGIGSPYVPYSNNNTGRFASFLGFDTYITDVTMYDQTITVNGNELQGFYVFGYEFTNEYLTEFNDIASGEGATTTVPNPLSATSPIPEGSCVVTGQIPGGLYIPDDLSEINPNYDILVTLQYSTNKSFEWNDTNGNGQWDIWVNGTMQEHVADMGTRGLWPILEYINSTDDDMPTTSEGDDDGSIRLTGLLTICISTFMGFVVYNN